MLIRNQKTREPPILFSIDDPGKIGAGSTIWTILALAAWNEEKRMNAERRMNVAISAQKSAIGQAYVPLKHHPQNKGNVDLNFSLVMKEGPCEH